jgi:hypothetical protein
MKKSEEMRIFFENRSGKKRQESVSTLKTEKAIPDKNETTTVLEDQPKESLVQKIKKKIVKIRS